MKRFIYKTLLLSVLCTTVYAQKFPNAEIKSPFQYQGVGEVIMQDDVVENDEIDDSEVYGPNNMPDIISVDQVQTDNLVNFSEEELESVDPDNIQPVTAKKEEVKPQKSKYIVHDISHINRSTIEEIESKTKKQLIEKYQSFINK